MRPDVVGVRVGLMAGAADEGLIVPLHHVAVIHLLAGGPQVDHALLLLACHLLVDLAPTVEAAPDAAEFRDGPEDGPFNLVDEVVVLVGALDEVGMVGVYCQLRLADKHVLETHVHQDIVSTFLQPVLYPYNLEEARLPLAQLRKVPEQL
jgi:hypothetical protein